MSSFRCNRADCSIDAAERPEKRWIGRSFGAAAMGYDGVAALQREVGESLLEDVRKMRLRPLRVLDLGAGTGHFTGRLATVFPEAGGLAVDIAEGMLRFLRARQPNANAIVGDAELLPLADASIDVIFSNMALQWCEHLDLVFAECRRVLRPGGVLAFSLFGGQTLYELRAAWRTVDGYSHVNAFETREAIEQSLHGQGFSGARVNASIHRRGYPSVMALMNELKTLGARNLTRNRPRHLLGRRTLERVAQAYERPPDRLAGVVASFEVLTALIVK